MAGTLAEARQAGVRHMVLLSGTSAASGDMSNAAALTSDSHEGRVYTVSGPESLRPADRAPHPG
jgi:uncharacterized protein YbjT (DUF2867 family)